MRKCRYFFLLVSCLFPALLWLPCSLAWAQDSAPRFEITPNRALCEEQVKAYLLNLKPNQHVTVRASAGLFRSELEFTADAQGRVDLGGPEPDVAREKEVAPFRIVWSMKTDPDARNDFPKKGAADPIKVTLAAFVDGKEVAMVDDLNRSIPYYRKLGFTFGDPWGGFYAIGTLDGLELHLKEAPKNATERKHRRDNEHLDAAAGVQGIEAFYEQCVSNGARILKSLAATEWGTKDFYVEDPDGYIICFGGQPADC